MEDHAEAQSLVGTSVQVPEPKTFCNHRRTRLGVKFVSHLLNVGADRGLTNP